MVFCNLSPSLSIAVKIGNRFNTTGKEIHVTKHYEDAIQKALDLIGQENFKIDMAVKNLCKSFNKPNRSLWPVEMLAEDAWQIQTAKYSNQAVIIDRCILHSTSKGKIESEHLPLIENMRSRCQTAISEDSMIKYIVVDSSKLKVGSRSVRLKYMPVF